VFVPPSPAISMAPPAATVRAPLGEDKSIVPAPEPAVAIVIAPLVMLVPPI
jgi:hypothetical protein